LPKVLADHDTRHSHSLQGHGFEVFFLCALFRLVLISPKFPSKMLLAMIFSLQGNNLSQQKMYTLKDIVLSQLFLNPECRAILLPDILAQVRDMLDRSNEVEKGSCRLAEDLIIYLHFTLFA